MINDHTLCYGHPWSILCKKCARNITDKVRDIDNSIFTILPAPPLNLKKGECPSFTKKLYKRR